MKKLNVILILIFAVFFTETVIAQPYTDAEKKAAGWQKINGKLTPPPPVPPRTDAQKRAAGWQMVNGKLTPPPTVPPRTDAQKRAAGWQMVNGKLTPPPAVPPRNNAQKRTAVNGRVNATNTPLPYNKMPEKPANRQLNRTNAIKNGINVKYRYGNIPPEKEQPKTNFKNSIYGPGPVSNEQPKANSKNNIYGPGPAERKNSQTNLKNTKVPANNQYQTLKLSPPNNTSQYDKVSSQNHYESANSTLGGGQNSNGRVKNTKVPANNQYQTLKLTPPKANSKNTKVPANNQYQTLKLTPPNNAYQYDKVRPTLERKKPVKSGLNGNNTYKPISAPKENPNKIKNTKKSSPNKKKKKKGKSALKFRKRG